MAGGPPSTLIDKQAPNHRKQAVSMERRLSLPENQHYADKYNVIIDKLIDSGTAVPVDPSEIKKPEGMVFAASLR